MPANSASKALYFSLFCLQAMACRTSTRFSEGFVPDLSPAANTRFVPGCWTVTDPSTTDMAEPAASGGTADTPPLAAAGGMRVPQPQQPPCRLPASTSPAPPLH